LVINQLEGEPKTFPTINNIRVRRVLNTHLLNFSFLKVVIVERSELPEPHRRLRRERLQLHLVCQQQVKQHFEHAAQLFLYE
jgi:hypothetical protein